SVRAYAPRKEPRAAVRLDAFSVKSELLATATLSLSATDNPRQPGYAAIHDLAALFPQLRDVDRYDVRVTPLVEGMEYWAVVSVTDNDTQQVLLITAD
ncbi:MAG TPA: hypothetical protein VFL80_12370, partial [Thermoanaerobaculia bacterium]|nr:hypothetical protein [Thermoanaerobaculia bacterium]